MPFTNLIGLSQSSGANYQNWPSKIVVMTCKFIFFICSFTFPFLYRFSSSKDATVDDAELLVYLPLPPKHRDYRYVPLYPGCVVLGNQTQSVIHDRQHYYINLIICPVPNSLSLFLYCLVSIHFRIYFRARVFRKLSECFPEEENFLPILHLPLHLSQYCSKKKIKINEESYFQLRAFPILAHAWE